MRCLHLILLCFLCCFADVQSSKATAQDFREAVFPITELKLGLGLSLPSSPRLQEKVEFGTGFCLDPSCRFVGTNYHVAATAQPRRIKGQKVIQRYFATGPDDKGATLNEGFQGLMKYNLSRDLAIFELQRSLPHHHGIAFSLDELEIGQSVDIYAYPLGINPLRKLRQFPGTFKGLTTSGLLAFDYTPSEGNAIHGGASGGIVVDRKAGQIVGILSEIAKGGRPIALAVSVKSLVEFAGKVQPYLAQSIFPAASAKGIPPLSSDLYPKFVPPSAHHLQQRPEEPPDVKLLRNKAQSQADSMRNFIAVQTFSWGFGEKETSVAAYEIRVVDGYQRFRELPDGTKDLRDVPFPPTNDAFVPGGEWSELPALVGSELKLKIQQVPDVVVGGKRFKVFQYHASPEDRVCEWRMVNDFLLFATGKTVAVECFGEVWTDQEMNILRASEHYELPGKWKNFQGIVTYGWLNRANEPSRLVPLTIATQAEYKKKIYWCRGAFVSYRMFSSHARLLAQDTHPPRASGDSVDQPK